MFFPGAIYTQNGKEHKGAVGQHTAEQERRRQQAEVTHCTACRTPVPVMEHEFIQKQTGKYGVYVGQEKACPDGTGVYRIEQVNDKGIQRFKGQIQI